MRIVSLNAKGLLQIHFHLFWWWDVLNWNEQNHHSVTHYISNHLCWLSITIREMLLPASCITHIRIITKLTPGGTQIRSILFEYLNFYLHWPQSCDSPVWRYYIVLSCIITYMTDACKYVLPYFVIFRMVFSGVLGTWWNCEMLTVFSLIQMK